MTLYKIEGQIRKLQKEVTNDEQLAKTLRAQLENAKNSILPSDSYSEVNQKINIVAHHQKNLRTCEKWIAETKKEIQKLENEMKKYK